MKVYRGIEGLDGKFDSPSLTLGNFDGVHLGHREILKRLRAGAARRNKAALVFTFDPHPAKVLRPETSPRLITPLAEKLELLEESGIDGVILADFNKTFAAQHPASFAEDVVHCRVGAGQVVIGHDFSFGKGKEGTISSLKTLGETLGFDVEVVEALSIDGEVVSSTRIRRLIGAGDVKGASSLLGRRHFIEGEVVRGHGRGKGLGFPTANIRYHAELLPADGVYAVEARLGGTHLPGIANIGLKPTFGDEERTLEVHLFGCNSDLYGQRVRISFWERVRGEIRFPDPEALVRQIGRDIEQAEKILRREAR